MTFSSRSKILSPLVLLLIVTPFGCDGPEDETADSIQPLTAAQGAPPSFMVGTKRAVFVDFRRATYNLLFDTRNGGRATVRSTIDFVVEQPGYPLYDSVQIPTSLSLDGTAVRDLLISSPGGKTSYRMLQRQLAAGPHRLVVNSPLVEGVQFDSAGPSSLFFFYDISDRNFLELYAASNLEFDQFAITMLVTIQGTFTAPEFFTNGSVSQLANNQWRITYPSRSNSSAPYFHMVPRGKFMVNRHQLTSVDGRTIPVTIYGSAREFPSLTGYWTETSRVFHELERTYGPWLHRGITIHAAQIGGGMEWPGATISDLSSLGHELMHSYFARGVMPVDGDAGWMDEAIAVWRDSGYPADAPGFPVDTNMANRSRYLRTPDRRAYQEGPMFMAQLNHAIAQRRPGGLKGFLRGLAAQHAFTPISTRQFQTWMEQYAGVSFQHLFGPAVYGGAAGPESTTATIQAAPSATNHHPVLTADTIRSLL
jgi:hypothetical protein